jgi:glutathione synthase
MKFAVLIDPIEQLQAYKDSTIAMIKRAQERGWACYYFTPNDIACRAGQAYAYVSSIHIGDVTAPRWATTKSLGEWPLSDFDIILMRKDPPFDLEYIYHTYALELASRRGVLVANRPQSLRDANEKFFTLNFPDCCPPTLVTRDSDRLRAFWQTHQQVIFKPLDGMGGSRIFHVDETGRNLSVILDVLTCRETVSIMAQQYIPDIVERGDKRILLINGEPIDYALARIPLAGELRGNLAAGGHGRVVSLTDHDRWICRQLAPTLREKGLYFVGIDVIGDYLTEINVTSPTCVTEIMQETGIDITGKYLDTLAGMRLEVNV